MDCSMLDQWITIQVTDKNGKSDLEEEEEEESPN
jgi:hypothetical protein